MKSNYLSRLIPILIIIIIAGWIVLPSSQQISLGPIQRPVRIVRGLDLQGGIRVLMEADLPASTVVTSDQMNTARGIVESRVNALGVSEPLVQVAGSRRILVELPGVGDTQQAVATIKQTGLLEFVDAGSGAPTLRAGQTIQTDYQTASAAEAGSTAAPTASEPAPTASQAAPAAEATGSATGAAPSPTPTQAPVYHTVMTGAVLKTAGVSVDQSGSPYVSFELTSDGAKLFGDYTSQHVSDYLAIVLDKQVISVPQIQTAITTGSGSITGSFTADEANSLAVQLRYGALPIPLRVVESQTVGPTLGQDSLRKSTTAGIIGLLVVISFMALYYRLPGVVADLALLVYAVITFALFELIPVTLTLPGIAGFVLSIGVAVDANVLIFERMKEELRGGRTLTQAIDMGFSRAWPSIRDSNLSTLITCAILYWFGSAFGASIVKGFALTLAIGVGVSLFTAITVTRTFLHLVLDGIGIGKHPRWFGV
jgi:preprotein translocase subunit SecD